MKNRFLHIDFEKVQSANADVSKCKICTLEEQAIINIILEDPTVTQKRIAELTGKIGALGQDHDSADAEKGSDLPRERETRR